MVTVTVGWPLQAALGHSSREMQTWLGRLVSKALLSCYAVMAVLAWRACFRAEGDTRKWNVLPWRRFLPSFYAGTCIIVCMLGSRGFRAEMAQERAD